MNFKSRAARPDTGMELGVTFAMPAGLDTPQSAAAILKFFEGVSKLSNETGAAWITFQCSVPEEFRPQFEAAFAQMKNPVGLKVVVNNDAP